MIKAQVYEQIEALWLFLSDFLMFEPQTWTRLIARYQQDWWPFQSIALLLGVVLLWLLYYRPRQADRLINAGLCLCWLWVGLVFHLQYVATISWAAWGFAGLFITQGVLFLLFGVLGGQLTYLSPSAKTRSNINRFAIMVIVFSLAIYPLITAALAGDWMQSSIFGLSPDATSLATMGFMLAAKPGVRGLWLLLPVLWLIISIFMGWVMAGSY